jgi:hypothetical protein
LRILPTAHFPIGTVDTRRYNIDDDFARCRHGIWQVAVFQDFRTTEVFNESRFHNLSPFRRSAHRFETNRSVPWLDDRELWVRDLLFNEGDVAPTLLGRQPRLGEAFGDPFDVPWPERLPAKMFSERVFRIDFFEFAPDATSLVDLSEIAKRRSE